MKMKKINYLILLVVVLVGISCEPTYVKTYSWAYPVAGDWTVKTYVDGEVFGKAREIKSYNSAFGKDSIWIDDIISYSPYASFWDFQAKIAVNMGSKTFGNGTNSVISAVPDYGIGVKVMNGKIIGNDSIYFEIQFGDDTDANGDPQPYGTTYQIKGHRTTSYEEYMR